MPAWKQSTATRVRIRRPACPALFTRHASAAPSSTGIRLAVKNPVLSLKKEFLTVPWVKLCQMNAE